MSIAGKQETLLEELALFQDWTERYEYVIGLGKKLPPMDESAKTPERLIRGCQSQVWLVPSGDASSLHFDAISDSAIVTGLIALLLRVYSDRPASEILATEPEFIQMIGLAKHLSPTRSNGLTAMLATIKHYAATV